MGKRAIYLDERERDLTRRVFTEVNNELGKTFDGGLERMAVMWTREEITRLRAKFEEPPDKQNDEGGLDQGLSAALGLVDKGGELKSKIKQLRKGIKDIQKHAGCHMRLVAGQPHGPLARIGDMATELLSPKRNTETGEM